MEKGIQTIWTNDKYTHYIGMSDVNIQNVSFELIQQELVYWKSSKSVFKQTGSSFKLPHKEKEMCIL